MSQDIFNDINPTVTSGTELADLLNDFKDAVVSGFSGTSRPANLQAGGYWVDTTNDPTQWALRFYDGTVDILLFNIDIVNGIASVSAGGDLLELAKISSDILPPVLKFLKQRTGGAQTLVGDNLGQVEMYGTDSGGIERKQANIKVQTLDNTSLTNLGAFLAIELASAGTGSLTEIVRLMNGRVGININNPSNAVHVRGDAVRVERAIAATDSAKVILEKKRIAGNGQVLNGDGIAKIEAQSTDQNGTQFEAANMEVVATETNTDVARGNKIVFKTIAIGSTSLVERASIDENGLNATALNIDELTSEEVNVENISNTTTSPKYKTKKARIAGSGQVLDNDGLGKIEAHSTDVDGDDFEAGFIEFYATENHDNTNRGTKVEIATIAPGDTALVTRINIDEVINIPGDVEIDGGLVIAGNLEVQGTTTTIDSTTLSVADANISVNVGGTQSSANTNNAGLTVEMTDATDARIAYDSTLASKFKMGEIGSESQVVTVGATQTLVGKTLTSPVINNGDINTPDIDGGTIDTSTITSSSIVTPSRLDVKQDTEANLTTYAATATNGQFVFATDTKVMYQIVDNALTSVGSGGGGVSAWVTEKYETLAAADLTRGNNATFGNGGSFGGTLSIQPAGIDGKSLQYLQGASSLNDWFEIIETRATTEAFTGKTNVFTCLVEYNGNDNEQKIVIWDNTNDAELGSVFIKATGAGQNRLYEIPHTIPTTCLSYQIGIQNVVLNNGKVTLIDNAEVDYNRIVSAQISNDSEWIDAGTITLASTGTVPTKGTINIDLIRYRFDGSDCVAQYIYRQTTAGTAGTGQLIYPTPAGLEITDDIPNYTTVVTNLLQTPDAVRSYIPTSGVVTNAGTSDGDVRAYKYSSTQFRLMLTDFFATGEVHSSSYYAFTGTNLSFNFEIRFRVKNRPAFNQAFLSNGTLGANWTDLNQTMTIGAVTTPPTKSSSVTRDKIFYKRDGSNGRFRYEYIQTNNTGATSGTGDYLFSLPIVNGQQLRFASSVPKVTAAIGNVNAIESARSSWGTGFIRSASGPSSGETYIIPYNDTQFRHVVSQLYVAMEPQDSAFFDLADGQLEFVIDFDVPIEGWNIENSVTVLSPMVRTAKFEDRKTLNTDGGTSATSFTTRTVNTQTGGLDFMSLVNGTTGVGGTATTLRFQPGKYFIWAQMPMFDSGATRVARARIRNTTNSTTLDESVSTALSQGGNDGGFSAIVCYCEVEFLVVTDIEFQCSASAARATVGLGIATNQGSYEVYTKGYALKLQ